ncbi:glutamate decarboxylase [Streptomyces clavuligerus]|uniref:Glutamate decarboxylase n=1 Tax=Streptomyces clavuligerus TaxID=1901 RepID=B5GPC6_STRCL|nr:glutamate decarboxylase [Streptomyces clavuligerus]ANW19670.1 glutamate decarboxylase [Streptomyces clavuligerus]AXU14283.1 glutamate decarboxylase [Streptomyces clavuligerus]EDY48172.1 glutamate decarboxylase [Streptomyces clavuligerus]EFG07494.1 Glutamate decarboxylase [Streptomyces clavuligerus]MBY6304285.1 glutamate decarboxylase [Streptomyces clavuligerus]
MPLHQGADDSAGRSAEMRRLSLNPFYGEADPVSGMTTAPPTHRLPDGPLPPMTAYQLVRDELMLDGNARLNLATFVTTWMEPQAGVLMGECRDKNMIDKDEYPRTAELERRCVAMLAELWRAPDPAAAVGCSTTGSSEACMLAGMALKRRWAKRHPDRYPSSARPNLVMGANVQVCWEKFCAFWEVEARLVPMEGERFHLDPQAAAELCDENTIGVVTVLGSTFDGSYEPVAEVCAALDALQERTGLDVPVHVDGASGAMVAPFVDEELVWDFRLPRVSSINTSGHKYGLVYPGVGWALWRSAAELPEELVFRVNYLGGDMPTFALNFSRPGAQVVAQYYTFLRLGREGYRAVQQTSRDVARGLADRFAAVPDFRLLTRGDQLPVFAVTTAPDVTAFNVFDVSRRLREHGWLVPAYTFPKNREDLSVLRVVCRNGFSADLAALLMEDLHRLLPELRRQPSPLTTDTEKATSFHH